MAIVTSVLTGGSNNHQTTSEEANGVYTDFASEGVVGAVGNTSGVAPSTGSFSVNAQGTPDMTVAVGSGVAYVTGTPTSQNSQTFRVKNTASSNVTISANSSGSTKYDWVYIKLDATKLNTPNTAADDVATLVTSRSSSAASDDGTPPTYGYPLAVVTVANGASTITNGTIRDIREQTGMTPTAVAVSTASWTSAGATPTAVVANGNRSYSLTWASSIISSKSVGMRNKYTRTVTAPTQCTDLESSSSQYYSKTSPAGAAQTDDITVMAWVKPESYTSGHIMSRTSTPGTNGWRLIINADGTITINGAGRFSSTIQSLPIDKWAHVAYTLDMSASTVTAYIDGISVPVSGLSSAGASWTAAGNLEVGSAAGTGFFDGKIAQAAVFSSVLSAATIRSYMSQGLAGNESTLISAYSFNNSIADLNTSNANNLTANGSALATNTDAPFAGGDVLYATDGTTEYSITTNISADGLTETVQVPEGYALPTSGGISAVSYSTQKVPYGFPADRGKWRLVTGFQGNVNTTSNATYGAFISGGFALTVPIGSWDVGYQLGGVFNPTTTVVYWNISPTALTGLSSTVGAQTSPFASWIFSPSASSTGIDIFKRGVQNVTVQSAYIMYTLGATASAGIDARGALCEIFAEFGLL